MRHALTLLCLLTACTTTPPTPAPDDTCVVDTDQVDAPTPPGDWLGGYCYAMARALPPGSRDLEQFAHGRWVAQWLFATGYTSAADLRAGGCDELDLERLRLYGAVAFLEAMARGDEACGLPCDDPDALPPVE